MDLSKFYLEYKNYIIALLSENRANRVNGSQKFVDFILVKFMANELDPEYDEFDENDLIELIEQKGDELLLWVQEHSPEITIKNRHSWSLSSSSEKPAPNIGINLETKLTKTETSLINKDVSSIDESKLEQLKQILVKLESLEERDVSLEAKCALLIAEIGYKQKDDQLNAIDWSIAGEKNKQLNQIAKAKLYFIRAGNLYSHCYLYAEAAKQFQKVIDLTNYKEIADDPEKEDFKKLLVDCRLQYERAGQNQEAANVFIKENDIKANESCWYIRFLMKLFKYTAHYGESPFRVAVTAIVTTLISILVYYIFGISDGVNIVKEDLGTSIYFAMVTFTTLGYGDYSPVGFVRVVAAAQAFFGLLLTSLFMVTLVRKFSR